MKKLTLLSIFLLFFSMASAQDYYYYQGQRITLQPRTDKIAVVLKSTANAALAETQVRALLSSSDTVAQVLPNVLLVSFSTARSLPEIQNLQTQMEAQDPVKFSSTVYFGESEQVSQIVTDEFIVRLRPSVTVAELNQFNALNGCTIVKPLLLARTYLLKSNDNVELNALQLSEIYRQSNLFEWTEPNFAYPSFCLLHSAPNDPLYSQQWAIKNTGTVPLTTGGNSVAGDATTTLGIAGADMSVEQAWNFATGAGVKIAILDSGVDELHEDLTGNIPLPGYDAFTDTYFSTKGQYDSQGHGTACAGLAAAVTNNGIGVAGIARNATLRSYRIFNPNAATAAQIATAITRAKNDGMDVLSNSWGGGSPSNLITNAIDDAATTGRGGLGCIILFSSGNDGRCPPSYPSWLPNVVCVGASTQQDVKKSAGTGNQWWWGGNFGERPYPGGGDLDIVAPTVCMTTDVTGNPSGIGYDPGNYTATFNGTSCSCPNAAGVAALILSVNTSLTRLQVIEFLYRGADKIDNIPYNVNKPFGKWNPYTGYGRVNALNSVRLAAGVDVTPPTIVHTNVLSHTSTYPTIITAEIVDQNGAPVPTTGPNSPRLFYRLKKGANPWSAFVEVSAFSVVGNVFSFQIPCVGHETQVQYYIRARDAAGNERTFPRFANPNFPTTLCYYAVGTFNTTSQTIPSFTLAPTSATGISVLSSSVTFSSPMTIVNTRVRLNMSTRRPVRQRVILQAQSITSSDPTNDRKVLYSFAGIGENGELWVYGTANAVWINNAIVSDTASQYFGNIPTPLSAAYSGSFLPDHVMRGYNGVSLPANHQWRVIATNSTPNTFSTPNDAVWNAIEIFLTHLSGTPSAAARLDSPADSILNFGNATTATVDLPFVLHNVGNATLTCGTPTFTGPSASRFSIQGTPPSSIAANSSGTFTIRYTPSTPGVDQAVLEIPTNDPSKPVFKVSLRGVAPTVYSNLFMPSGSPSTITFGGTNLTFTANVTTPATVNVGFYNFDIPVPGTLPPNIVRISKYYWAIQSSTLGFSSGVVRIPLTAIAGLGTQLNKLHILKRDEPANPGDPWQDIGGTIVGGNLESTVAFSSLSEFAIGDEIDGDSPLPVELAAFTGQATPQGVQLSWQTASELNNAGFIVMRSVVPAAGENATPAVAIASYEFSRALQGKGTTTSTTQYSYLDNTVEVGKTYTYRLRSVDFDGTIHDYPQTVTVEVREPIQARAYDYALEQNYPNPFNPSTIIRFTMKEAGTATLTVTDILGRVVKQEQLQARAGENIYRFVAEGLPSGMYFYTLRAANFQQTKKMVLIK
ncbi:MAG: S8 family serine peptidase [Chloroherpetonaceae bacterium]|nr:S8 family serine peptidase [Chloroherpetonaceae bacterium]